MLMEANERGNGKQLARHLLNIEDNEHVDVHEVRGFVSDDVTGAFKEAQACASGTHCKNYLFSVSFNPPPDKDVPISVFEDAIDRVEQRTGLSGQPRVVVFHEKNGRRHAHCVWSRIDAETMTAKNLSHYKLKTMDISREIFLEQDWKMPAGLTKSQNRDPRNFSLAEWQHCKRMGKDARDVKTTIQDAWAISDSAATFGHALRERGFTLAKGDRRGFVAVTHEGEVLSVARFANKKAKDVRAKLGEPEKLPSVDEAKVQIARDMRGAFARHAHEAKTQHAEEMRRFEEQRQHVTAHHRAERENLKKGQQERFEREARERSARLNSGLKGLWQRVSGQRGKIEKQNEREAYEAVLRDRAQTDALILQQLQDRRKLQQEIKGTHDRHNEQTQDIKTDQSRYREMQRDPTAALRPPEQKSKPSSLDTDMHRKAGLAKTDFQRATEPVQAPERPSNEDRLARLRNRDRDPKQQTRQRPEIER